jgi:hypothetical protein
MKKLIVSVLLVAGMVSVISCTKQEQAQVVAAITPIGACIADVALAVSGVEDPVAIANSCGAAISDVYTVINELLANNPAIVSDAGNTIVDAGVPMSPAMKAHLTRIRERVIVSFNGSR